VNSLRNYIYMIYPGSHENRLFGLHRAIIRIPDWIKHASLAVTTSLLVTLQHGSMPAIAHQEPTGTPIQPSTQLVVAKAAEKTTKSTPVQESVNDKVKPNPDLLLGLKFIIGPAILIAAGILFIPKDKETVEPDARILSTEHLEIGYFHDNIIELSTPSLNRYEYPKLEETIRLLGTHFIIKYDIVGQEKFTLVIRLHPTDLDELNRTLSRIGLSIEETEYYLLQNTPELKRRRRNTQLANTTIDVAINAISGVTNLPTALRYQLERPQPQPWEMSYLVEKGYQLVHREVTAEQSGSAH
jgi:hypothetical protein